MAKRGRKPKVDVLDWDRLPTVEHLAQELVSQHHPHLERAKILVLGRPKARKSGERTIIASAKAVGPEIATALKGTHGEVHYLVVVGRDAWNGLEAAQRRIELDRALCACAGQDEKGRWTMQGYDIQDYRRMVDWYGVYHADAQLYVKVANEQLELTLKGGPQA